MSRISIPTARKGGILGAMRAFWTVPTTLVGHATARLFGCHKPQRVGGQATSAWLYRLPDGRFKSWRAIAIGHVIIVEPAFLAKHTRWLLAHELSHIQPAHQSLITDVLRSRPLLCTTITQSTSRRRVEMSQSCVRCLTEDIRISGPAGPAVGTSGSGQFRTFSASEHAGSGVYQSTSCQRGVPKPPGRKW
jgi:hypothetical protein